MSDFDPYYKWLGIPPEDQPPTYYRLLGLRDFEKDADVIDAAADRQSSHIRKYQSGPHGKQSQELLNEIARARLRLLQPETREKYDRKLRSILEQESDTQSPPASSPSQERELSPPAAASTASAASAEAKSATGYKATNVELLPAIPPGPRASNPPGMQPSEPYMVVPLSYVEQTGQAFQQPQALPSPYQHKSSSGMPPAVLWTLVALGCCGVLFALVYVIIAATSASNTVQQVDNFQQAQKEFINDFQKRQEAFRRNQTQRRNTRNRTAKNNPAPINKTTPKTNPPPPPSPAPPRKEPIDLLSMIDLTEDKIAGRWSVENGELIAGERTQDCPRVQLPYIPPEEYDFRVVFTLPKQNSLAVHLNMPGKGTTFCWKAGKGVCGFTVNQQNDNHTTRKIPDLLKDNQQHETVCQVRKDGVKGFVDGRLITEYKTDFRDMKTNIYHQLRDKRLVGVESNYPAIFHKIEIIEISGRGQFTRTPQKADVGSPVTPAPPSGQPIDLLALIDPEQDKVVGDWSLKNGALVLGVRPREVPRMQIPYIPPEEYDYRVVFSKPKVGQSVCLNMPGKGATFMWAVGGGGEKGINGFTVNQKNENKTTRYIPNLIQDNQIHTMTCQVRKDGVKGFVDGKLISEYKTDLSDMKANGYHQLLDKRLLGVESTTPTVFHEIEVIEISGRGQFTRPPQ